MELSEIISYYRPVSEACMADILSASKLINVQPEETVVRQGEMCDAFYLCRSGLLRVVHNSGKKENTILFGSTGDIFTSLHSFFMNEPSAFSLCALEPGEIYAIDYAAVRELATCHPDFCHWLMYIAFGQLYALERRYVKYATTTAEERFHNFLARDTPYIKRVSANSLNLRVPLKYIASYLQITPATLSRLRRKLVQK